MITRYFGPVVLLAAIVVGDQIRVHRPDHKYRLSMAVETPDGVKSASGVMSVHPDRGYVQGGTTQTKGDAIALDLGEGRMLFALLAHEDGTVDLEDINFVAVRAFSAAGQRGVFKQMDRVVGSVPVTGKLMPLLASFANVADPSTMKVLKPDDLVSSFGPNVRLRGVSVEIVPNGFWPLDFGGVLGEPVTRGIARLLPWLDGPGAPASTAIAAAGSKLKPGDDARKAFTR